MKKVAKKVAVKKMLSRRCHNDGCKRPTAYSRMVKGKEVIYCAHHWQSEVEDDPARKKQIKQWEASIVKVEKPAPKKKVVKKRAGRRA